MKMRDFLYNRLFYVIVGLILLVLVGVSIYNNAPLSDSRIYNNDVKVVSLNTKIEVSKDGKKYSTIDGDILKFVEDPLKMTKDGQVVANAGDDYNFIDQDDHAIYVGGKEEVVMDGEVKVFGELYNLYDNNGKYIGKADFNYFNTTGHIYGKDCNEIARYTSIMFMKDYKVYIRDNDILSDDAILMIFASYYSDQNYDNR